MDEPRSRRHVRSENATAAASSNRSEILYSELKTNIRTLCRRPGFSAVVIITLALGLGVNAAMFSFLDRAMRS